MEVIKTVGNDKVKVKELVVRTRETIDRFNDVYVTMTDKRILVELTEKEKVTYILDNVIWYRVAIE